MTHNTKAEVQQLSYKVTMLSDRKKELLKELIGIDKEILVCFNKRYNIICGNKEGKTK